MDGIAQTHPVVNASVLALVPRMHRYLEGGEEYDGNLHIVLDNWNIEDLILDHILDETKLSAEPSRELISAFRALSLAERIGAMGVAEGYLDESGRALNAN